MAGDMAIQTPLALLAQPTIPCSAAYESLRLPSYTRSIRLLSLDPSNDFATPLAGTLRQVSLDDADCPQFNALSYVWGTFASPTDTLKCCTGDFQITANCRDALCRLRHMYGGITIWVDAICIDQDNNEEKQHQITLMREIYMRAERVYFWIGKETPALERAIKCLSAAAGVYHLLTHPARARKSSFSFQQTYRYLKMLSPVLVLISIYKCLQDLFTGFQLWGIYHQYKQTDFDELFSREWFLRSWTFQETVLAYDSVVVCGSVTIKWETFVRGFRCVDCLFTVWLLEPFGDEYLAYQKMIGPKYRDSALNKMIPQSFRVFSGVIDRWMRVKRPKFRHDIQRRLPSFTYLFHRYRKARCDIEMYFSPYGHYLCPHKLLRCVALSFVMTFLFVPCQILGIMYLAYTNVSILAPILALLRRGKPQAQIYHELFLALLRQSSLAIILLLDAGRDAGSIADAAMAGAPSWVPNWGRWPTITIPDNYFARLRLGITTGFNPRVGLGQGPGTLLVYGHLKGHIEVCQGRFRKIDIDANITTLYKAVKTSVTWARAARNKTQLLTDFSFDWGSLSPNPDGMRDWRVLQPDSPSWPDTYLGSRQEPLSSEQTLHIEDDVEQFFVKEMENCRPQDQSRDVAKKITRNLLEDKRILAYFIHLVNTITLDDRPKFLTSRGYIGCGSKGIAVGDRIALIDGVPAAPLILRPHNTSSPGISDVGCSQRYSVICSAFIDGFPRGDLGGSDYEGEIVLL